MYELKCKNRQSGFTIIELLVVVAVGGILASLAMPIYQAVVKNNCLTTKTNMLVGSFHLARSTAIKHKSNVTITAASVTASNEWGLGWSITLDEDRNYDSVLDANEDYNGNGVLDNNIAVRDVSLTCDATTFDEIGNDTVFVYGADGFIDAAGTFDVCDDRAGETGRQIKISNTGRLRTDSSYIGCS